MLKDCIHQHSGFKCLATRLVEEIKYPLAQLAVFSMCNYLIFGRLHLMPYATFDVNSSHTLNRYQVLELKHTK
jgi:hypothetical protein